MTFALACLTLVLLLACCLAAAVWRTSSWFVAVLVLSVIWVLDNRPLEGPVLIRFNDAHGLTAADLLAVAAWVLIAVLVRRRAAARSAVSGRH